jgi:D-tyrosyl-tRNA(Tyr) deacylase
MRAVIQRVKYSSVSVDGEIVGKINQGFMVLLGITHTDGDREIDWLSKKIKDLRVFEDENPHKYKVDLSSDLIELKYNLIKGIKAEIEK